jgi:hypothetical protein
MSDGPLDVGYEDDTSRWKRFLQLALVGGRLLKSVSTGSSPDVKRASSLGVKVTYLTGPAGRLLSAISRRDGMPFAYF